MPPIPMRWSRRRLMLAARIPNSLLTLINKSHPLAWTKSLAGTDTEIEGCEASVGQIKEVKPAVVTDEDVVRVGGVDRKAWQFHAQQLDFELRPSVR